MLAVPAAALPQNPTDEAPVVSLLQEAATGAAIAALANARLEPTPISGPRNAAADSPAAAPPKQVAPEVGSFELLPTLVRQGDEVTIGHNAGHTVKGRILDLTPSTVRLVVNGQVFAFGQNNVAEIRQRRRDSLKNGLLWGLGIGAALGVLSDTAMEWEWGPISTVTYSLLGLPIGLGIDAAIKRDQVIYQRPSSTPTRRRRLSVAPFISPTGKGVSATVRF